MLDATRITTAPPLVEITNDTWLLIVKPSGAFIVMLFVLALFMVIFIANRLSINILDENTECIDTSYEDFINMLDNLTVLYDIYITIGISILFFYL